MWCMGMGRVWGGLGGLVGGCETSGSLGGGSPSTQNYKIDLYQSLPSTFIIPKNATARNKNINPGPHRWNETKLVHVY